MTVESVTYISDLNTSYPDGGDPKSEGDDHIRNIKLALRNTFPNVNGPVSATDEQISFLSSSGITNADLVKLHAVTADAAELNKVDGLLASTAELNLLQGLGAVAAELNTTVGATASDQGSGITAGGNWTKVAGILLPVNSKWAWLYAQMTAGASFSPATMFTLPAGYRPITQLEHVLGVVNDATDNKNYPATFQMTTGGNVTWALSGGISIAAGDTFFLNTLIRRAS